VERLIVLSDFENVNYSSEDFLFPCRGGEAVSQGTRSPKWKIIILSHLHALHVYYYTGLGDILKLD